MAVFAVAQHSESRERFCSEEACARGSVAALQMEEFATICASCTEEFEAVVALLAARKWLERAVLELSRSETESRETMEKCFDALVVSLAGREESERRTIALISAIDQLGDEERARRASIASAEGASRSGTLTPSGRTIAILMSESLGRAEVADAEVHHVSSVLVYGARTITLFGVEASSRRDLLLDEAEHFVATAAFEAAERNGIHVARISAPLAAQETRERGFFERESERLLQRIVDQHFAALGTLTPVRLRSSGGDGNDVAGLHSAAFASPLPVRSVAGGLGVGNGGFGSGGFARGFASSGVGARGALSITRTTGFSTTPAAGVAAEVRSPSVSAVVTPRHDDPQLSASEAVESERGPSEPQPVAPVRFGFGRPTGFGSDSVGRSSVSSHASQATAGGGFAKKSSSAADDGPGYKPSSRREALERWVVRR